MEPETEVEEQAEVHKRGQGVRRSCFRLLLTSSPLALVCVPPLVLRLPFQAPLEYPIVSESSRLPHAVCTQRRVSDLTARSFLIRIYEMTDQHNRLDILQLMYHNNCREK